MESPAIRRRRCARPGCGRFAVASFCYDYRARTVWLTPQYDEPDPSRYDLCPQHAERLTPPYGWRLIDRRPRPEISPVPDEAPLEVVVPAAS